MFSRFGGSLSLDVPSVWVFPNFGCSLGLVGPSICHVRRGGAFWRLGDSRWNFIPTELKSCFTGLPQEFQYWVDWTYKANKDYFSYEHVWVRQDERVVSHVWIRQDNSFMSFLSLLRYVSCLCCECRVTCMNAPVWTRRVTCRCCVVPHVCIHQDERDVSDGFVVSCRMSLFLVVASCHTSLLRVKCAKIKASCHIPLLRCVTCLCCECGVKCMNAPRWMRFVACLCCS